MLEETREIEDKAWMLAETETETETKLDERGKTPSASGPHR
jgi:hypothetical protein